MAFGFAGFRWVPPDVQAEGVALYVLLCLRGALVVVPMVLAFPCCLVGLLALPLCGAALTFFAAAKKVSKESG
ncbi:MAG: hypothetical protein RXR52_11135, partial [Paraburkholderia sp.]